MKEIPFDEVKVGETVRLKKDPCAIYTRLSDTKKGNSRFQPINAYGEQYVHWARFCSRWHCVLLETQEEVTAAVKAKLEQIGGDYRSRA